MVRLSARLWIAYLHQVRVKAARVAVENRLRQKRQQLIVDHMPTARAIAHQVFHRFRHANASGSSRISLEDMVSCAYIGLVEAAGRWEPAKGEFQKYLYFRVRGAVIDAHRRQAYQELLPISLEEWTESHLGENNSSASYSYHEEALRDTAPLPDELAGDGQVTAVLFGVIDRVLPDEERQVIREALGGANLSEIARAHGRSALWARTKLSAARECVAREVQRRVA